MEVWRIVLYGLAALSALKSLAALMTAHRDRLRQEYQVRELQRQADAEAHARAAAAAQKAKQSQKGAA